MNEEQKEEFLKSICSIADWVKTPDDLLKYCIHIKYRFQQALEKIDFYQKKSKLSDDEIHELQDLHSACDDAYASRGPLMSFEEGLKQMVPIKAAEEAMKE